MRDKIKKCRALLVAVSPANKGKGKGKGHPRTGYEGPEGE
jgi:hypothetical protein